MSNPPRPTKKVAKPDWLGSTPFESFREYGDTDDGGVWYGRIGFHPFASLHDTHKTALQGEPRSLEAMRLYYLALITRRLKP